MKHLYVSSHSSNSKYIRVNWFFGGSVERTGEQALDKHLEHLGNVHMLVNEYRLLDVKNHP